MEQSSLLTWGWGHGQAEQHGMSEKGSQKLPLAVALGEFNLAICVFCKEECVFSKVTDVLHLILWFNNYQG